MADVQTAVDEVIHSVEDSGHGRVPWEPETVRHSLSAVNGEYNDGVPIREENLMPRPRDPSRTDITGRAYAGSQRQIQTYVNERTAELSRAVADALQPYDVDALPMRWVSPLAAEMYCEYSDAEFLQAIGVGHLAARLRQFWPRGGPCWDALAQVVGGGCILVEAKSHIPEIFGKGCGASARSLPLIRSSLARTKVWLNSSPDADWLGCLYQSANRIASLYFLREIGRVNAYLVNVYFTDDPHSRTSRQQWDIAIKQVNEQLGIPQKVPYSASVFLEAQRL